MANEILGFEPITTAPLFPWNRRDLTSLVDEKGKYLGMDDLTLESALSSANAHITRLNAAQTSPTFPVEFDDPDEGEEDEDEVVRNPDNSEEDE